mmetsp:Transcript_1951/g.2956  ORF Transcript_1951/g.2956 Transcript_1951/m.2956 type:complete len:85 (+) Transcript_1951:3971-4225(+)
MQVALLFPLLSSFILSIYFILFSSRETAASAEERRRSSSCNCTKRKKKLASYIYTTRAHTAFSMGWHKQGRACQSLGQRSAQPI